MKIIVKYLLLILVLCSPLSMLAQVEMHFDYGCNYKSDKVKGDYTLFDPTKKAADVVDEILRKVAIKERTFTLKAADVENAQATIRGEADRYLLYSNEFLKKFTSDARTKWAAYAVFAHEIGHHVLLHNLKDTSAVNRKKYELQADAWAARILARMGASREDALAAVNALTDDNSRYYPRKTARVEQMGIAYDEEKITLIKTQDVINAANTTAIAIDPKSFNRWSIIKKENVKATIDDDKVVVQLNNISGFYSGRQLSIKLTSNDGNMGVTKVEGTGEDIKYSSEKKIIWRYTEDGVAKITASSAERLRISVYAMNNKPQKAGGVGWGIGSAIVGTGGIVLGFIMRNQAQNGDDYTTYKTVLDENKSPYVGGNRNDFYSRANGKYVQSQVILGAGVVLAVLGTTIWVKKAKINQQAREAGFGYMPEKKQWIIEPMVSNSGGIGLRLRF